MHGVWCKSDQHSQSHNYLKCRHFVISTEKTAYGISWKIGLYTITAHILLFKEFSDSYKEKPTWYIKFGLEIL